MNKSDLRFGMWLDTSKLTIDQVIKIKMEYNHTDNYISRSYQPLWLKHNSMLVWDKNDEEFVGHNLDVYNAWYGRDIKPDLEITYEDLFGASLADTFFLRYDSFQEGDPTTKRVWKYGTERVFIILDHKPTKRHLRTLKQQLLGMGDLHAAADNVVNSND